MARLLAFLLASFVALALSACNGGSSVLTPGHGPIAVMPSPSATPTGSQIASGLFAGIVPVQSGTMTSPLPLPTPSSGAYTTAGLAGLLDAASTPAPGSPIGTVGVVTSAGPASFVVTQVPLLPANDASGNAIPLAHNVALVGSFDTPLTVAVDGTTIFSNAGGLAALTPGTLVFAGGTSSGSMLQAQIVGVLATATSKASAAATRILPPSAPSLRRNASLGTDVANAFTRQISNLGPALTVHGTPLQFTTGPLPCRDALGLPSKGTGTWMASLETQAIFSLGNLNANFPFTITYDPLPPQFVDNNGSFSGPGPVADWLNFVAQNGTDAAPTLDLTAGADIGASLKIGTDCPGNLPPFELASATLGYAIESATTKPMPGPGRPPVTLDAKTCIGINSPLNINLFANPGSGFANFNPFGSYSTANLNFCDQPTLGGDYVAATVNDLSGASINNTAATFDPGQTGPASVYGFGTLFPSADTVNFVLGNWTYHPNYKDGYRLQISIAGNDVLGTPPDSSMFPVAFNGLTASNVPVTITTQRQLCGNVTTGNAFLGKSSSCNGKGAIDFEFCRDSATKTCPGEASGTSGTVQISEPGYTGPFTVLDDQGGFGAFGGGCEDGTTQTYAVGVSPRSANGSSAAFTISIGALQTPGRDAGCNIFILDSTQHYVQIALQFISYSN